MVHLYEAMDNFPNIPVFELGLPKLKKLAKFSAGRVLVLFHPTLYRALKPKYPIDIGSIVLDGWMTLEIGIGSIGQFVSSLLPQISVHYVNRMITIFSFRFKNVYQDIQPECKWLEGLE